MEKITEDYYSYEVVKLLKEKGLAEIAPEGMYNN